ncbi:MAG: hypothetical protein H8E35_15715 [Ardenticatenia bacterium]|nr:hypothetical protein [Ardenticatenia bacterium]
MSEDMVLANGAGKLVHGSPRIDWRNPKDHSGTNHIDNAKGALTAWASPAARVRGEHLCYRADYNAPGAADLLSRVEALVSPPP